MKIHNPSAHIEKTAEGIRFSVKVVPGSSRTSLAGILEGSFKVRVAAPPEKGKANQKLIEFLSHLLGVRKNQITILAGATSPVKTMEITGITLEQACRAFSQDIQRNE